MKEHFKKLFDLNMLDSDSPSPIIRDVDSILEEIPSAIPFGLAEKWSNAFGSEADVNFFNDVNLFTICHETDDCANFMEYQLKLESVWLLPSWFHIGFQCQNEKYCGMLVHFKSKSPEKGGCAIL